MVAAELVSHRGSAGRCWRLGRRGRRKYGSLHAAAAHEGKGGWVARAAALDGGRPRPGPCTLLLFMALMLRVLVPD